MQLETLYERSKNISIFCIFLNLLIILILQCYLLLQTEIITAGNTFYESDSTNQQYLNLHALQERICSDCAKRIVKSQKICSKSSHWSKHAAMAGATLIEEFVDLPINVLLFFAIKQKKKNMLIPWLILNSLRIVAIIIIVCLFVIFNIVGIGRFNGETAVVVNMPEDNH